MSMNVPPEDNMNVQPTVDTAQAAQPEVPVAPAAPVEQAEVAQIEDATPQTTQEQAAQEQQAVDAIGQAIADEQISARDILTAVLSDTIGLSPAGANALIDILMTDLIGDEAAAQAPVENTTVAEAPAQPTDVPPQV